MIRFSRSPSGRHFLQIPGPTNAPDRILRAMDHATIDHRGPEFGELRRKVLAEIRPSSRRARRGHPPRLRHRRLGGGAGQHALARRPRADVRDRPFRPAWRGVARALGLARRFRRRRLAPRRRSGRASRRGCAKTEAHAIKAVCVVHNETSTGVTCRIGAIRRAIDATGHPALLLVDTISSLASIDFRHDEWRVDVTVAGSQKGLMLPPGLAFNASAPRRWRAPRGAAAAPLLGLAADPGAPTRPAISPTRPRPTSSSACTRRSTC